MAKKTPAVGSPSSREGVRRPWRLGIGVAALAGVVWLGAFLFAAPPEDSAGLPVARIYLLLVLDQLILDWFDGPTSWSGVGDRILVLGAALLGAVPAVLAGRAIVGATSLGAAATTAERWGLGAATGLSLQSSLVLLLGCVGALRIPGAAVLLFGSVAGAGLLAVAWERYRTGPAGARGESVPLAAEEPSPGAGAPRPAPEADAAVPVLPAWVRRAPHALAAVLVALLLLRAMMPPFEYDVREYHLQAPKEWWQTGQITFMPHNIYANMPLAAEMQALAAMVLWHGLGGGADSWWWGALAGKTVLAGYTLVLALLCRSLVRRWAPPNIAPIAADWAVPITLGFPALAHVSTLGYVEGATACFFAAGLLALSVGASWPARAGFAGFFAGSAIACKYPALLFVAVPLAAIVLWQIGRRAAEKKLAGEEPGGDERTKEASRGGRWQMALRALAAAMALFGLGIALGWGPWLAKNALLAGNPVYPLAANLFGGRTLTPEKIAQWQAAHRIAPQGAGELIGAVGRLSWSWPQQGAALVPLALIGLLVHGRRPVVRALAGGLLFALFAWLLATHRIERFLLPAVPLAIALAAFGAAALFRALGARLALAILCAAMVLDAAMLASPLLGDLRLAVDLDYLRRDDLSQSDVSRIPEHIRYVNAHLSPDDRVLVVGDAQAFDYEVPIAYATTFDTSPLIELLAQSEASGWDAALSASGYTHLLIDWPEIQRLRGTYGFDPRITPERIDRLRRAGVVEPLEVEPSETRVDLYRFRRPP